MAGTVLGAGVTAVSKTRTVLPSWNLYIVDRGTKREGGRKDGESFRM